MTNGRTGGVIVFDVTSPEKPLFEYYTNNRNFSVVIDENNWQSAGDLDPEGIQFLPADKVCFFIY